MLDSGPETVGKVKESPNPDLDRAALVAACRARMGPLPKRSTDEVGRLLPRTDEQKKENAERSRQSIARMRQMTDESETDEMWSEIYRNIDAERPHRKLFEGMY